MLAYPCGLTWCRKSENLYKSIDIGFATAILPRRLQWLSGRVSDSVARGRGFETYLLQVVSFIKTLYSPKVLVHVGPE